MDNEEKKINKKKVIIAAIMVSLTVLIIAGIVISIVLNSTKTQETLSEIDSVEVANAGDKVENDIWQISKETDNKTEQEEQSNEPQENEEKNNSDNNSIIYLTFDDGPSSNITPKILDILKEEDVPATFFVINYSSENEKLVKREVEEGHSVGIHGYSHEYKKIYKSEETYMKNVYDLQAKIEKSTGIKTTITRFPGGSSNTVSSFNKNIMTKLTKRIEEEGFKYYDWNVDSDDAGSAKTKKQVYSNVTKALKKNRSNVVLMHDFSGNEKTLNALKSIIEYGKENGYTFKSISADSDLVMHHKIFN